MKTEAESPTSGLFARKPLPICKLPGCGKRVGRHERLYCSRRCYGDSLITTGVKRNRKRGAATRVSQAVAVGIKKRDHIQTNCRFDNETFWQIRGQAEALRISFSMQVRLLVAQGLCSIGKPVKLPQVMHTKYKVASGCKLNEISVQAMCIFDIETFEVIRQLAVESGTGVGEQIRLLIEWGLSEEKMAA